MTHYPETHRKSLETSGNRPRWFPEVFTNFCFGKIKKKNLLKYGLLLSECSGSVEHFLAIFVITFVWVQQQSNTKPTQKWWQKWSRNVQLVRVAFGKKYLTSYKIHTVVKTSENRRDRFPEISGGFPNYPSLTYEFFFSFFEQLKTS